MLRKLFLLDPDAKDTSGGADPSPAADANPTEEATPSIASAAVDAKPKEWFDESKQDAFTKKYEKPVEETKTDETASSADEKPEAKLPGEVKLSNSTEEKADPKGEKPKVEDFSDLPFHKHPRFTELITERNKLKEATAEAAPQLERLKSVDSYMQANRISPEQFKDVMEITALINTNPAEALKRLQPVNDYLAKMKGQILPQDLQSEVDAGTTPLERAQEIARLRSQIEFKEQTAKQDAQQTRTQLLTTTLSQWEDTVKRLDPDYSRKQPQVIARFVNLSASQPWSTPDQALVLAKQAYDEVNDMIKSFIPKPARTRSLGSNNSSAAAEKVTELKWDDKSLADRYVAKFATRSR